MNIRRAINIALAAKQITQKDLADKINYTVRGFSNLMRKNHFYVDTLEEIANVLDYDIEIVLTDRKSGERIVCR